MHWNSGWQKKKMNNILQLSEEDFFQWVQKQLERRKCLYGCNQEQGFLKEELYDILFYEQNLTSQEIERYFIPFRQAGYLSPRRKFELMLFVMEKDYGESFLFLEGTGPQNAISEFDIERAYQQWLLEERMYLSEEEKKEFFVQYLTDKLGLGMLEVLKRVAPDGILIGELCPILKNLECTETRTAICADGMVIHLPFLTIESHEELVRIIKHFLALENRGELTEKEPVLDFVREDGTSITAVRPPAAQNWGLRILYGAAKKGGQMWRK